MKKTDAAQLIGTILDKLYPKPPIPLQHKDPFTLLCAVVLSAQCTDDRVNLVTPELFALADTPGAMAQQSVEAVRLIIRSCGLGPAKSAALVALSQKIMAEHQGEVPRTFEELEALPGVGHKTASVVMSHAFGIPAFPVDTHIHRLAYRWRLSSGKSVTQTEADLKLLWEPTLWERRHLQLIYFGRQHCPARGHDPQECPICSRLGCREPSDSKR